jgi:hypothetical protein
MTTAIMNFAFAPVSGLFGGFNDFFTSVGKCRAAAELHRLGYHDEAKYLMLTDNKDL